MRNMKLQSPSLLSFSANNLILPDYFTLSVVCQRSNTEITMQVLTKEVTTHHMVHVTKLLKAYLPTILESSCFNEKNLPFHEEVTRTELGHLFEHILLEYLCKEKINAGNREAVFRGVTMWNWNKDSVGTFHITIDVNDSEQELLYFALEQSALLLKRIIHYHSLSHRYQPILQSSQVRSPSFTEKQMV